MELELIRYFPNLVAAGAVMLIFADWFLSDLRSWNREVEKEEKSRFDQSADLVPESVIAPIMGDPEPQLGTGNSPAFWLMLGASLAIVGLSAYIVLGGAFDASEQRWAFGAAGMIIGYWLRPAG